MVLSFLPSLGPPEILVLLFMGLIFGFWIWALIDVIRRTDFNGLTRTVWIIGLFVFFFAPPIIYLILKLVNRKPIPETTNYLNN